MELRNEIACVIRAYAEPDSAPDTEAGEIADKILAIPEIAEALAFTGKFKASGYNVSVENKGHWTTTDEPGSW